MRANTRNKPQKHYTMLKKPNPENHILYNANYVKCEKKCKFKKIDNR